MRTGDGRTALYLPHFLERTSVTLITRKKTSNMNFQPMSSSNSERLHVMARRLSDRRLVCFLGSRRQLDRTRTFDHHYLYRASARTMTAASCLRLGPRKEDPGDEPRSCSFTGGIPAGGRKAWKGEMHGSQGIEH